MWARRALNCQKRWCPARAVSRRAALACGSASLEACMEWALAAPPDSPPAGAAAYPASDDPGDAAVAAAIRGLSMAAPPAPAPVADMADFPDCPRPPGAVKRP